MKLYNEARENCKYGHFDIEKKAGYVLTDGDKLTEPWYYVYTNRKILLYVDQNGPVKMQYEPPSGVLITKRELGETESKWQVWVQSPDINDGVPVSNFNSPWLRADKERPKMQVAWTPEKAIYTLCFEKADIITEIFVPSDKATVCMKTAVVNKSKEEIEIAVTPAIFPYINVPQMVAWDLPEWYLGSKAYKNGCALTMHGQMKDPLMIAENRRSVTFNFDYEKNAEFELNMSKFKGAGNFFSPESVKKNTPFTQTMDQADGVSFGSYQSVYTARYKDKLQAGESKTYTQVMTVQDARTYNAEENVYEQGYFDEKEYAKRMQKTQAFYNDLFTKRTVKTENKLFDNFINTFTPLQMYWVGSLDRGWPSSMRGSRDASQDFCGITPLDPEWTRKTMLELLEHQQTDGWFPRQVSTISRTAPHDMRYFCDGGAFFLELVHEYLTFTRDYTILKEKVVWLNADEQSTVLEHILRTVEYYLDKNNIGEHGLCKVWYGDWWDVMDKIGMEGIGESVTVTAQNVLNLKNLADAFKWLYNIGEVDESYLALGKKYLEEREKFIQAMRKYAYNEEGFFNGYYNDNRKWLLSNNDPDGESRVYLVSNAWAIISGSATKGQTDSVKAVVERECFGRMGYNTKSKGYAVYVDKAGRVGNGTSPGADSYNHAQSFWIRACCTAGDAETAYKATRYILPIEEKYAPVEMTYAPPYAIANKYSNSDKSLHRVQLQFLSGTVSYMLRIYYNYIFGITYDYDGLQIKPCLSKTFGDCEVTFGYLGKKFTVKYTQSKTKKTFFNGEEWTKTRICEENGKEYPFFADSDMQEENSIEISY